jgi:hypothetical protein
MRISSQFKQLIIDGEDIYMQKDLVISSDPDERILVVVKNIHFSEGAKVIDSGLGELTLSGCTFGR